MFSHLNKLSLQNILHIKINFTIFQIILVCFSMFCWVICHLKEKRRSFFEQLDRVVDCIIILHYRYVLFFEGGVYHSVTVWVKYEQEKLRTNTRPLFWIYITKYFTSIMQPWQNSFNLPAWRSDYKLLNFYLFKPHSTRWTTVRQ